MPHVCSLSDIAQMDRQQVKVEEEETEEKQTETPDIERTVLTSYSVYGL